MAGETGSLESDQLFKGLTRPPMILGVSYMFFVLNFVVTMVAYIMFNDLKILLVLFPIVHAIAYVICFKEPLFVELFIVRSQKCSRCANKFYHGANSYDVY